MRGDFVTIAIQGDFGKPRPALVIQKLQGKEAQNHPNPVCAHHPAATSVAEKV